MSNSYQYYAILQELLESTCLSMGDIGQNITALYLIGGTSVKVSTTLPR